MKVTFDLLVYNVHIFSCTVLNPFSILEYAKSSQNYHVVVELCMLPLPSIKIHIRLASKSVIKLGTV